MLFFDSFRRHPLGGSLLAVAVLAVILIFLFSKKPSFFTPRLVEVKNSTGQTTAVFSEPGQNSPEENHLIGADTNQITNFLILGAAGPGYDAPDLTDTILVVRLDNNQKKIYLFSLPRDLIVETPQSKSFSKLNALYAIAKKNKGHEFDLIKQKVEEITGLGIAYYIFVDLTTVKNLVDTLGGVNVMVKKDVYDTAFPGPNHSFQTFTIKAGWRYLDGETALKYIRSRHSSAGDLDRIERQQEVLQALKQKVLQLSFWDIPTFFDIFSTIASQIKTDLSFWQIKNFWEKVKDIPAANTIKTEVGTADLVTTGQTVLGAEIASIVQPKAGLENYGEIKNYIEKIISQ